MLRFRPPNRVPRPVISALVAGLLLAAASGCQGDRTAPAGRQPGPTSGPSTSQDQTGNGQSREDFPNRGRLVEDLSVGEVDGAAEYVFGFIADIAIGPDGSIYVADGQAKVVRQYDANGRFVRNFGRAGRGPGEFNAPLMVAVHPDGRVLIGDDGTSGAVGADRIHVFSSEGRLVDTWHFPGLIEAPITVDTVGGVYVRINGEIQTNGGPLTRPGGAPPVRSASTPLAPGARAVTWVEVLNRPPPPPTSPGGIRLRPDGSVLDTITARALPGFPTWRPASTQGAVIFTAFRYTPISWWAWSPLGHMLSGYSREYAIQVHDPERAAGAPLRQLSRVVTPIPLMADEREEHRIALGAYDSSRGQWVGSVEVPASKPAYHSVFVGREGRVWVGVHLPSVRISGDWFEPVTAFDVWEPTGEYLGRVEGPSSIREAVIDGDMLLTWTRDELGVERVVRYRVVWE